jgi:hypothetical protein
MPVVQGTDSCAKFGMGASGRCRADKLISARREARPDGENIAALQPAAERGGRCEWPTIKGGQAE